MLNYIFWNEYFNISPTKNFELTKQEHFVKAEGPDFKLSEISKNLCLVEIRNQMFIQQKESEAMNKTNKQTNHRVLK